MYTIAHCKSRSQHLEHQNKFVVLRENIHLIVLILNIYSHICVTPNYSAILSNNDAVNK